MRNPGIERDLLYGANLVHDKAQLDVPMVAVGVKLQGGDVMFRGELRNG